LEHTGLAWPVIQHWIDPLWRDSVARFFGQREHISPFAQVGRERDARLPPLMDYVVKRRVSAVLRLEIGGGLLDVPFQELQIGMARQPLERQSIAAVA